MTFPWNDRAGRFSLLKAAALAACVLPAALGLYWLCTGAFGPLPVKAAMKYVGLWSLRFLVLTLALTPLQRLLGWTKLALLRRMLGLTAAFYAMAHFALFFPFSGWSLGKVASEIASRFYLALGLTALAPLLILAVTSSDHWIKRLGPAWKHLHQLAYLIAFVALVHMSLQEKLDATPALQLLGLFLLLMIYRLYLRGRWPAQATYLALTALMAAALTAVTEAGWYGAINGLPPVRLLLANISLSNGLRPAQLVLLAGTGFALAAALRGLRDAKLKVGYNRPSNSAVG